MIFKNLILKKIVKDEKAKSHPYTTQGFKVNNKPICYSVQLEFGLNACT